MLGIACLLLVAASAPVARALVFDAGAAKSRPVARVVKLLQDMSEQLALEAREDQETYDKMACWCATNDREKSKAISDAQSRITEITSNIDQLTAASSRLNVEIKGLRDDVAASQASLAQAAAIRQQQLTAFSAEQKDLMGSIAALKAALAVLSKHHPGALLQGPEGMLLGVASTIQGQLHRHASMLAGVLTPTERSLLEAFTQAPDAQSARSGEIFGILRQMLETFESNLAQAQSEELSNQRLFEGLKSSKRAELVAWESHLNSKTQELASTDQKLAQSKEDIEDTRNSLSADQAFLLMLKKKCAITDKEWEERQKTRSAEMEAVSQAIAMLSSDDSRDLFSRTFNPSFVQKSSQAVSKRRSAASKVLQTVAIRLHSSELMALASLAKLDTFARVKKAIDDLVAQLLRQKADEIKHKDFCVDEFNRNQLQTERKERAKNDLAAQLDDLKITHASIGKSIDAIKADIAEMQLQLKRAGEDRERQHKEFQTTLADQREAQKLLQQALVVLTRVYAVAPPALLVQGRTRQPGRPAAPAGFDGYSHNKASGGVIGLIQQIIADARAMEAEAIRAENDSQAAYEGFVRDVNAAVAAKGADIVNKSRTKATTEGDLVRAKLSKEAVVLELEQLSNSNAQLHQSCDFITKTFDLRQTARDEEIEALNQAKAILSGASFE